ncbi:MAG: guanylate kinase [Candidatus Oxydemutatoraceae bacterium WSBS_2016_MAG_OTU14]
MDLPLKIFVVSGLSGAGKTSLLKAVLEQCQDMQTSISYTTRPPKKDEKNGCDYYFVSDEVFFKMQEAGEFLENAEVFGHRYGTALHVLKELHDKGKKIILEVDWQGAQSVRKKIKTCSIFILPPSRQALLERLTLRDRESEEEIQSRFNKTFDELRNSHEFDFLLVNDDFAETTEKLKNILRGQTQSYIAPSQDWIKQLMGD